MPMTAVCVYNIFCKKETKSNHKKEKYVKSLVQFFCLNIFRTEDDWDARLKDGKCVGLVKTGTCMQPTKKQPGQSVLFQT